MSLLKSIGFFAFLLVFLTSSVNAQNVFTWTGGSSNNWQVAGNWTDSGFTGSTPGAAVLASLDTATVATGTNLPITLNGTATVGTLNVDVVGFALNGSGNLKANLIDATGFGNITIGATLGDATNGLANVAGTPTATNGGLELRVDTGSTANLSAMISVNNTFRSDSGTVNYNGPITLSAAASGTATTFRSNTNTTAVHNFNSAISGTGSVLYAGAGTWNHNVANTYTGGTTLGSNGPNAASIHVIKNDLAFSSGTLTFTGGAIAQTVQGDGTGPRILANRISLGRDAIFAGTDQFTLTGDVFQSNTRNLTNNITGNQLSVNGRMFAASDNTGRILTLNGSGTTVVNNAFFDRYDSATSAPVPLTGPNYGSLSYNGTGTLILGNGFVGNNTGWTEVRQGTLQVGLGGATPILGGVAISGGQTTTTGTMVFNHNDSIIAKPMNLQMNVTNTGGGNLALNSPSFGNGTITASGGGTVFVNGGNFAGSTITDAARPAVNVLVVSSTQASAYGIGQSLTVSGVTSASVAFSVPNLFVVNKADLGNGTFQVDLSGNIGSTAGTANGYTVVADAGTGTGLRSVIANGGVVAGTGVIGGNLTVAPTSGSFVAPGTSIGTLTVNGFGNILGTMNIEFDGASGQKIDLLNFGGNLTLGASSVLNLQQLGTTLDGTTPYTFATYGGNLTGTFGTVNLGSLTGIYQVNYAFGGNNIAIVAVPEPSSIAMMGIGFAGAWTVRRRLKRDRKKV